MESRDRFNNWIDKIRYSSLSEDNKEAFIKYIEEKSKMGESGALPSLSFFIQIIISTNVNLKSLSDEDMSHMFEYLYKISWLYTPYYFVQIREQFKKFLRIINDSYDLGLNPEEELRRFMRKKHRRFVMIFKELPEAQNMEAKNGN